MVVFGEYGHAPTPSINWLLDIGGQAGRHRPNLFTVNSVYGILRAVESGIGIGALPNYMVGDATLLERVLPELAGPPVDAYFVYPEELRHSKRIAVFRDYLVARVAETRFLGTDIGRRPAPACSSAVNAASMWPKPCGFRISAKKRRDGAPRPCLLNHPQVLRCSTTEHGRRASWERHFGQSFRAPHRNQGSWDPASSPRREASLFNWPRWQHRGLFSASGPYERARRLAAPGPDVRPDGRIRPTSGSPPRSCQRSLTTS